MAQDDAATTGENQAVNIRVLTNDFDGDGDALTSVLESLRANLQVFTLSSVLEEVQRWWQEGLSLFARQWQQLQAKLAPTVPDTG